MEILSRLPVIPWSVLVALLWISIFLLCRKNPPSKRSFAVHSLKTFAAAFAITFTLAPTVVVGSMVGNIVPATLYLFHCLLNTEARGAFWHDSNASAALSYFFETGILVFVACYLVFCVRFCWVRYRAKSGENVSKS
jgi:uncharacterized PurR-regulated membrane protein YhhQ (DUF165 family)